MYDGSGESEKCTAVVVAESETAGPKRDKRSLGWFEKSQEYERTWPM